MRPFGSIRDLAHGVGAPRSRRLLRDTGQPQGRCRHRHRPASQSDPAVPRGPDRQQVEPCQCAPGYNPWWWNTQPRRSMNNCYNYATNFCTDTFAQPGREAGAMYQQLSCAEVTQAAMADGQRPHPGPWCSLLGHTVVVVARQAGTASWYRRPRRLLEPRPPVDCPRRAWTTLDASSWTHGQPTAAHTRTSACS